MSSVTMNANLANRNWFKLALCYAAALLTTTFFALPLVWLVLSSIKSDGDVAAYPPKLFFEPSLANYYKLFTELDAGTAIYNSFFIVTIATLLAMVMGTMAAYALARCSVKNREIIAFQFLTIRMTPPIVSVIPLFIIARSIGVFDTPWLLIAVYALNGLPFVVWVLRVFIQDLPKSIEEAALIDGCGRYEVLYRVTLPLLLPGFAAVLVIIFMFAWNEYLLASMLTSSEARTLPILAANAIKPKSISWGLACAAGVMMSLPVIFVVLSAQRYLVRGLTLGAVKG